MTFFKKFSLLCTTKGVSPRAVALTVGFDPSAIAQWKRRGGLPRPAVAVQLADYFGVAVEELVDDSKELPPMALMRMASSIAQKKYPSNSQAADENFDAQTFERLFLQERKAHADTLRTFAKLLSDQAADCLAKAKALDSDTGHMVSATTTPKPLPPKK